MSMIAKTTYPIPIYLLDQIHYRPSSLQLFNNMTGTEKQANPPTL